MKIIKGKKAIFFTLIAVSLLGISIYSFTTTYTYTLEQKASVTENIIDAMDRFINDIDQDMQNAIYISGFRAITSMTDHIATEGEFINNTQEAFEELFMEGTYAGNNATLMQNNTFPYWVTKINQEANKAGMEISLTTTGLLIQHLDPWTIRIDVNATMNLTDMKNTANWTQEKTVSSSISIIGFEDPSYIKYTGSNIFKRINQTIHEGNFTTNSSTENFREHVNKTYYTAFKGAPSFLMRFEDDLSASPYGIESFVSKDEISAFHSCPAETSSIDSIYWNCNTGIETYSMENWPGFRIDNQTDGEGLTRIELYMAEDHIIG